MRISDWSSDVCSSDLPAVLVDQHVGILAPALVIALQDVEHAEQAGVEGGDGEAVLQVGADVGNAHLQRRKARRGTHVPPDLGAVLEQAGAHHDRSEEHTSELQSLMRISYAVFCLKKK